MILVEVFFTKIRILVLER